MNYGVWPARSYPKPAQTLLAGHDDLLMRQAALDGVLPYNDAGHQTLLYWTMAEGYTADGIVTPPPEVRQWLGDFYAEPGIAALYTILQGTQPDWASAIYPVLEMQDAILTVRRLQASNTLAPWIPALGGMFPAIAPNPDLPGMIQRGVPGAAGLSPVDGAILYWKGVANSRWQGATGDTAALLAMMPQKPYPETNDASAFYFAPNTPIGGRDGNAVIAPYLPGGFLAGQIPPGMTISPDGTHLVPVVTPPIIPVIVAAPSLPPSVPPSPPASGGAQSLGGAIAPSAIQAPIPTPAPVASGFKTVGTIIVAGVVIYLLTQGD